MRLVLSGHEHNFQHSVVDGIHYLISGAAGKLRTEPPTDFASAGTRAWAASAHFLLIELDQTQAVVHPVADVNSDGSLKLVEMREPNGRRVRGPLEIR